MELFFRNLWKFCIKWIYKYYEPSYGKQRHEMIKLSNDQLLESVFIKIFMDIIVRIFKGKTFNRLDMRHFNPAKSTGLFCCISCSSNQRRAFSGHTTTDTATPRMLCGDTIKCFWKQDIRQYGLLNIFKTTCRIS